MDDILERAQRLFPFTQAMRRDLHCHPELAFQEVRTAGIVARELSQLGLEVATGIAETGVVALLEGSQPGPVALVRFDMDALPIREETGAEYASKNDGIMHACGHDGHVAIGLTVAKMLTEQRDALHGTVKFVFQPAEEGMGGAERMIQAGILDEPNVDFCLALHVWNEQPLGWVGVKAGPLMAGADMFEVTIEGKGGHGALPNNTVDPVIAAAHIVTALQTIVSRNISPLETAVVSVGKMQAGNAFNVIPQYAELSGTFRTYKPEVREKLISRFQELVQGVAGSFGCTARIQVTRLTPAVINDAKITAAALSAVKNIPGLRVDTEYQTMVSEDMAFMMEKAPGCYMLVGSANAEKNLVFGHHHPKFDFDEAVLPNAVVVMTAAVMGMLK